MHLRSRLGALIFLPLVLSCISCASLPIVKSAEAFDPNQWTPATPPVPNYDGLPGFVEADAKNLVEATQKVISSSEFRTNLARYDQISLGLRQCSISGNRVMQWYLGKADVPSQKPTYYKGWKSLGCDTTLATTSIEPDSDRATTNLCAIVIDRWKSTSTHAKACAINTIAHEWAHTISEPGKPVTNPLFEDGGYRLARLTEQWAFASYFIGAVAQCTYLAQQKDPLAEDLDKCLEHVGTTAFNANSCY